MTEERIEDFRKIVLPMCKKLSEINYEGLGESNAEEFKKDFNEILELAAKALEQQPCYNPDEWCHDCSEYDHDKHCCPRFNRVIRNAVEEIKQHCEDAISREDALMCMTGEYLADKEYKPEDIISKHIQRLRALPPVQPKIRTGHWIDDKCSVCGKGIEDLISSSEWYRNEEPNFCPFCGVKLIEPEQDQLWMYMIFNKDKIKEKTEQWTKEAEKAGMTLTKYLESINPLNDMENHSIKTVTNAKDAENYPISEDISKGIEEINKLIFENGQAESEE